MSVGRRPGRRPARPSAAGLASVAAIALAARCSPRLALAGVPVAHRAAGGDPRSSGQGPGLVGDPLAAIVVVAVVALASLAATLCTSG